MNKDLKLGIAHLLNDAFHEITSLRQHNEILQAQVRVIAVFEAALLGPPRSGGMALDIRHRLNDTAELLKQQVEREGKEDE